MSGGVSWELAVNEALVRVGSDREAAEPGERWGLLRDPRSSDPGEAARFAAELGDADLFGSA